MTEKDTVRQYAVQIVLVSVVAIVIPYGTLEFLVTSAGRATVASGSQQLLSLVVEKQKSIAA
jgi:hypothetical protein